MGSPFQLYIHPLFPPSISPSGFLLFIYFSSLSIRHAVPGTSDGSFTFNLVFHRTQLPPSLRHSVSLSVLLVCFFPSHFPPFQFVFVESL